MEARKWFNIFLHLLRVLAYIGFFGGLMTCGWGVLLSIQGHYAFQNTNFYGFQSAVSRWTNFFLAVVIPFLIILFINPVKKDEIGSRYFGALTVKRVLKNLLFLLLIIAFAYLLIGLLTAFGPILLLMLIGKE